MNSRVLARAWAAVMTGVLTVAMLTVATPALAEPNENPPLTLPDTPEHGVARAQIFESFVEDQSVYEDTIQFVWNGSLDQPDGVLASHYLFEQWQNEYDIDWFLENRPEWVVYQDDRETVAYYPGASSVPYDFTDPEARQWYWDTRIQKHIDAGYKVFALDMLSPMNLNQRAGHYDEDGVWVQQFDPTNSPAGSCIYCWDDTAFAEAIVEYAEWLTHEFHEQGVAVAANVWIPAEPTDWEFEWAKTMAGVVDIVLDEGGIVNKRVYSQQQKPGNGLEDDWWAKRFDYYRHVVDVLDKHLIVIDDTYIPAAADAPAEQAAYSVANHLLYRETGTMLWFGRHYHYWNDRPELHVDIGTAVTGPVQTSGGAWLRAYTNGLTVVNPSATSTTTVTLPPGEYVDLAGNTVSGSVELGPTVGDVLTLVTADSCDQVVTGEVDHLVVRGGGTTCLVGATVTGNISVLNGASLRIHGSTVSGSVTAHSSGSVAIAASVLKAAVLATSSGAVDIQHSQINGALALHGNSSVRVSGSSVGGSFVCQGSPHVLESDVPNVIDGAAAGDCDL